MQFKPVIVLLLLLIAIMSPAYGAENSKKLVIKNSAGEEVVRGKSISKTVSLEEAKSKTKEYEEAGILKKDSSDEEEEDDEEGNNGKESSENSEDSGNSYGYENVSDSDYIRNEVAAGNKLFLTDLATGLDGSLWNDSLAVSESGEDAEGISDMYKFTTLEPDPYSDPNVLKLYGGYTNLVLYFAVLFILGESIARNIDRLDITSSTRYFIPKRKFVGGLALCTLAVMGNVFFKFALDLIHVLNLYIMAPTIPVMAANPDDIITVLVIRLSDILVSVFFLIRYCVSYIFAVACGIIIALYVPKATRRFAANTLEKMARLLVMQPAVLFVISVSIIAINSISGLAQIGGYLGITVMSFLTCWYCMFGNFDALKRQLKL